MQTFLPWLARILILDPLFKKKWPWTDSLLTTMVSSMYVIVRIFLPFRPKKWKKNRKGVNPFLKFTIRVSHISSSMRISLGIRKENNKSSWAHGPLRKWNSAHIKQKGCQIEECRVLFDVMWTNRVKGFKICSG